MYPARLLLAICGLSIAQTASAETVFPQGIWAVGDPSACAIDAMFIRARDRSWEFTDISGQTHVQRVVRSSGRDYVTESDAASWAYHFDTPSSARVTDLWSQRSFKLVRCGIDSLVGLHEQR